MNYIKLILLTITVLLFSGCVAKSPVHNAAKSGDISSVEKFLESGGNIEESPPKKSLDRRIYI